MQLLRTERVNVALLPEAIGTVTNGDDRTSISYSS